MNPCRPRKLSNHPHYKPTCQSKTSVQICQTIKTSNEAASCEAASLLVFIEPRLTAKIPTCPGRDLNPHAPYETQDFKSCASADFATWAAWFLNITVSKGVIMERKYARFLGNMQVYPTIFAAQSVTNEGKSPIL